MASNTVITGIIERMLSFDRYQTIMNQVRKVDVSTDIDFQTLFDSYYEVRRNQDWRDKYYAYFQQVKNTPIQFDEIIDYCFKNMLTAKGSSNPVEASFSSKMLATINPNMPILDSQVLTNMSLKVEGKTPEEKLESAKVVYKEICDRYTNYIASSDCKKAVALFDESFPDYATFTTTRKIDWFLWASSKEELTEMGLFGGLL